VSDGYVFWSSTKLIYRDLFSREKIIIHKQNLPPKLKVSLHSEKIA